SIKVHKNGCKCTFIGVYQFHESLFLLYFRFIDPEPEYQRMFNDELMAFRERIRNRARVKLAEAMQQLEEEERQNRLGPGGLDPQEVMNELPKVIGALIMPIEVHYHLYQTDDLKLILKLIRRNNMLSVFLHFLSFSRITLKYRSGH
ncbi:unnamed protein product, partial [Rodentolepis nana]|uniref:F-box domain-containing protein n=1 Tax=Rodentolepis nana TaxID=102285 RepID=A0A0R3TA57_RODNA